MKDYTEVKENFKKLLQRYGIKNVHTFAVKGGWESSNIYSNLNGRFQIGIGRLIEYAKIIGCSFEEVLDVFYHEELEELRANRKEPVENECGE